MFTEDQLIKEVIKGNQQAIRHLLEEYQDYIFSICKTVLKSKQESEEATQDTFLKIIRALPRYVKKGKLSTWIYSVAYRTSLDYLRKRKYTDELTGVDKASTSGIEERIERDERSHKISLLLQNLNAKERVLIRMHYFDEMSIKEISVITKLSESNVKVKLFRARKNLAEHAKKHKNYSDLINIRV